MKPASNKGQNQKENEECSKKKGWWNKAIAVVIVILILLIFFISTRDYEKFKIVNINSAEKFEPWLELIVEATKECNKLANETYKGGCYRGVADSVGYNNFEKYPQVCLDFSSTLRGPCDMGAGRRIGEEFYNDTDAIFTKCVSEKNLCAGEAIMSAARLLSYHNQSFEYCKTFKTELQPCYHGMGWGLKEQNFHTLNVDSVCEPLTEDRKLSCRHGVNRAIAEYISKNPSYTKFANNKVIQAIQQSNYSLSPEHLFAVVGFYAGMNYAEEQEVAFSICDTLNEGLDESLKFVCYKNMFKGIGYAYYSELFNKTYLDIK